MFVYKHITKQISIISAARKAYEFHLLEINRLKSILDNLSENDNQSKPYDTANNFIGFVVNMLSDNHPKLTSDLYEQYCIISGTRMKQRSFISLLSLYAQKSNFLCYTTKGNGKLYNKWWVMNDWVVDGELREKYLNKIQKRLSSFD